MSDLLNSASLVMIPSGYKEDTVYSVVPSDGSGDLSFTRASNGTRVNSAGLVEVCPWNLIDNSNNFSAGAWLLQEVTSTSGQIDPTGASNGWRFNETTATGQHRFYYSFIAFNTGVITQSIYVKSLGRDQIFIGANSNSENFIFTFSTETISSVTGFTSTSATNVGNGWYRLTATFIGFSPINCLFVQGYNGGLSYAGDTAKGFYAFGGQLNIGSTAKPYFPTTDRLNVPRLTYQNGGGGCPSLLLEKQSTNLVVQSNDMTQWVNGAGTMTKNATTSPDGTNNALSFDNSGDCSTFASASNGVYSWSLFVKQGTSATASIDMSDGATGDVITTFTFSTKTFSGTSAGGSWTSPSTSYIDLGNGWYRITLTATKNAGSSIGHKIIASGSGYTYVYGAQLEASSYPTSYIPTTSSSATRVADACFKDSITSLIGQTEGTIFADIIRTTSTSNDTFWVNISDGTTNDWIFMGTEGTAGRFYVRVGNSVKVDEYPAFSVGRHKIALAYKSGQIAGYMDGVQLFTSIATFTLTSLTRLSLGPSSASGNTINTPAQINQVTLFKTRLTNAELASLTTI